MRVFRRVFRNRLRTLTSFSKIVNFIISRSKDYNCTFCAVFSSNSLRTCATVASNTINSTVSVVFAWIKRTRICIRKKTKKHAFMNVLDNFHLEIFKPSERKMLSKASFESLTLVFNYTMQNLLYCKCVLYIEKC